MCAIRPDDSAQSEAFEGDAQPELACTEPAGLRMPEPQWTAPISAEDARNALRDARALAADGKLDDALLALRVVEHALPRIGDRIAVRRAELLMRVGRPAEACEAYKLAEQSPERNVAAQARIELVRCLLEAGKHDGETELDKVSRRYPHLIGRAELRLTLARARERWSNVTGAVAIYRSIDLDEPESPAADEARTAFARIAASGAAVRPYTGPEQLDRAQRLVERGSVEAARAAVGVLLAQTALPALLRGRARLLAAKMARTEGRWSDVRDEVAQAIALGVPAADAARLLPRGSAPVDGHDPAQLAEAEARIRKLLGGHALHEVKNDKLVSVFEIAIQRKLQGRASEVLEVMRQRASLSPSIRYNAAILAFGLASDVSVADLLDSVTEVPSYAVSGRYHRARALERLGRLGEAESEYLRVMKDDKRSPHYYAMWADLRLWSMQSSATKSCAPAGTLHPDVVALIDSLQGPLPTTALTPTSLTANELPAADSAALASANAVTAAGEAPAQADAPNAADALPAQAAEPEAQAAQEVTSAADPTQVEADAEAARVATLRQRVLARLGPLSAAYGAAYPWLARAADLVELDLFEDAADEIGEAYLAFRDARGELRLRSGLEAVLTGSAPPRHSADGELRRQRSSLDKASRSALAEVADLLGDPGVSLGFGGAGGELRPRAYSDEVDKAATKYGLDPNLLFAVMRVESIYHRQIVSFAGAVGLMQIMPRTGMLIARKLGVERFEVSDLLDPKVNVEFAAWYLSSLIKRFDGRVPLAIAAYNGGPHNVRLWMRENNPDMPLEAFLERIPFSQTHEYVRRVLTHYAAYRAQQNLPMAQLDASLPTATPDSMAF
ncbi:MAG TPA: transglycosylase SLT domain-containing protein [Polyangiales bacterium]